MTLLLFSPLPGFDFTTEERKRASYYYVLTQFNKLNRQGSKDLDYDSWLTNRFILPFSLSGENMPKNDPAQKLEIKPIAPNNQFNLYLRFENPTQKVLRAVLIYSQLRSLAIESDR